MAKLRRSASAAESVPSAARSARPARTPASSATATEWKQLETNDGIDQSDLEASAKLSLDIKGILEEKPLYVPLHQDWEDYCARRQVQLLQRIKGHDDEYDVENLLQACEDGFDCDLILKEVAVEDVLARFEEVLDVVLVVVLLDPL